MNFDFACVAAMLVICMLSLWTALRTRPVFFPFGKWGRAILIVNSLALGVVCWATLAFRLIEIIK